MAVAAAIPMRLPTTTATSAALPATISSGTSIVAAAAVLYTLIVEIYIYRDLTWKKVIKIAREAMSLAGAIIVTTPQDIALMDARRGVRTADDGCVKLPLEQHVIGVSGSTGDRCAT